MRGGTDNQEFDLIVIGAGPVGENVADRAVQGGLTVAIIESELVGGECSYWACMPSNVLLRAGAATRAAQDAPGAQVSAPVDVEAVLRRRDEIVHEWNDSGKVEWLQGAGVELIRGFGRLTGVFTGSYDLERSRPNRTNGDWIANVAQHQCNWANSTGGVRN